MSAQRLFPGEIIDPEDGVRHKADGIQPVGNHHQRYHKRQRGGPRRGGRFLVGVRLPGSRRRGCAQRVQPHEVTVAAEAGEHDQQAQCQPGGGKADGQQRRHHQRRNQRAQPDAGEHQCADSGTPGRRRRGQGKRRPHDHKNRPGHARDQPPEKKPAEASGACAQQKTQGNAGKAQPEQTAGVVAFRQRMAGECANQIAQQIGCAQVGRLAGAEPFGLNNRRQ